MPSVSRRTILAAGAGTTGVAALLGATNPLAAAATPPAARARASALDSPAPARSHYVELLGQTFTAESEAGNFELVLDEIADLTPVLVADDEDRFNLLFSAPSDFADGLFTLAHPAAPSQLLNISAYGPTSESLTVQALINRSA